MVLVSKARQRSDSGSVLYKKKFLLSSFVRVFIINGSAYCSIFGY